MLTLDNVCYTYPGQQRPAVNSVSLSISPGEYVCLMGPNGCGKSTLALLLAGTLKSGRGTIRYSRPAEDSGSESIGLLMQTPENQFVALTVDKEIAFSLENRAVQRPQMEGRIEATLKSFGIANLKLRMLDRLSGGEQQRAAIASIMVDKPSLLILDEPDSQLDAAGNRLLEEMIGEIRQINPSSAIVRISQYPRVARNADKLIQMHEGRIVNVSGGAKIESRAPVSDFAEPTRAAVKSISELFEPGGADDHDALDRIELDRVSCSRNEGDSLFSDLSFTISAGEILGIVGPSGCGKSTLALTLRGLLQAQTGAIRYLSRDGHELDKRQAEDQISLMLQNPERQFFLPDCGQELSFGPQQKEMRLSPQEQADLLGVVGLSAEFLERDPVSLSVGEKRRLALAVAIALRPRVAIFDEPGAGLDPVGMGNFVAVSGLLRRAGVGQVVISHDAEIIKSLADRVLLITDGKCSLFRTSEFMNSDLFQTHMIV